jgi:diguanylate cyclase (GGDEF)-like protein
MHLRLPHSLANRRTALVANTIVIVGLGGFAVWAAETTHQSVHDVKQLTTLSEAYQRARYSVAQENLATRAYVQQPSSDAVTAFRRAYDMFNETIVAGRSDEDLEHTIVATDLSAQNSAVATTFAEIQEAARRNDILTVNDINETRLQPLFESMTVTLDRAAATHHDRAMTSLGQSQRSERIVLAATGLTLLLGLLFAASAAVVLSYRDRLARVAQREVERLKRAALTDSLTGLGNHRAFEEELGRALEGADRTGEPLSLALLDLDGLKQTNDQYGHQAGDECIRALADGLLDAGPNTSAYRIGGDEFAVILRGRRSIDALYLVQHLQSELQKTAAEWPVGASAGLAEAVDNEGRDALIRQADLALIQAKRSHRRCLLYNESLEPILQAPDAAAEKRHTDALATALARAVDAKDAYTHSHCETVSELCAMIGHELGFDPAHVSRLRLAGLLHDVGKIGITDSILQKPSLLTEEEYAVMKRHTQFGYDIVCAAERPEEARWILHHHERVDGQGYPHGLTGEQIPIESRIILVADAFEAITADRPYRMHRSADEALEELERWSGTQFDPTCVAALRRVVAVEHRLAA